MVFHVHHDFCGAPGEEKVGGCKGRNGKCIHCSGLLQVLRNVERPDECPGAQKEVPPTARMCAWNNPGSGDMTDPCQAAAMVVLRKPRRLIEHTPALNRCCLREDLGRALYDPLPEPLGNLHAHPVFRASLRRIFRTVRVAHGGRACAADGAWDWDRRFSSAPSSLPALVVTASAAAAVPAASSPFSSAAPLPSLPPLSGPAATALRRSAREGRSEFRQAAGVWTQRLGLA